MSEFRAVWHNLTLAGAKRVRDHALIKASELGIPVSVVVVDRTGVILLMETADSAPPGAPEASMMKAKGAARYRIATHRTAEFVKTLSPALAQHALSLPEVCAFQGGVPILIDGEIVGGVGVSGGLGEQDVAVATTAADILSKPPTVPEVLSGLVTPGENGIALCSVRHFWRMMEKIFPRSNK